MTPSRSTPIRTARLVLRPSEPDDATRAFAIQSNWNVTRNLRMASWPPERAQLDAWFATHAGEWRDGTAYRFAMVLDRAMIGLIDLDEIANREGDIGYWLDEGHWGKGFAFEAASALVSFAFSSAALTALNSGHAADNAASGKVLAKLGFQRVDAVSLWYKARGAPCPHLRYRLRAAL